MVRIIMRDNGQSSGILLSKKVEIFDEFDEWVVIHQIFPLNVFPMKLTVN